MKGQVPVFEVIVVAIILFTSFAIFFPGEGLTSRWDEAELALKGRDAVVTMERVGEVNDFAANPSLFTDFMIKAVPGQNLIYGNTIDGTVQPTVTVACNCTVEQIQDMLNWIGRAKLNGRDVNVDVLATTLTPIQEADVLVIWGRKDLAQFEPAILDYIKRGNGVVGIADFPDATNPDDTYTEIFGIIECDVITNPACQSNSDGDLNFEVPTSADDLIYQPYKMFHRMPIRSIVAQDVPPVPILTEGGIQPCAGPGFPVAFVFKSTTANYWICSSPAAAYFDTNGNNIADTIVEELDDFTIQGENFNMRYVEVNRTFISIREGYEFDDFSGDANDVYPADLDRSKIFLRDGPSGIRPIPAVVFNTSGSGMTAWMPEEIFTGTVGHDDRLLMQTVILSAANKNSKASPLGDIKGGSVTTYIDVANRDMFEVYRFNLGIGFPF